MGSAEKTEKRILPVTLTTEELSSYSYDLARKEGEAIDLANQKKAVAADFKGQIDILRDRIAVLAKKVETRSEDRSVECDVIFFDETAEVEIVRRDTGEVVTRRPMTDSERQKPLPIEFKPKSVASEPKS